MHEVKLTLADVIGTPDTWPDYSRRSNGKRIDMRRARISEFASSDCGIIIATRGSVDGPTYTEVFVESRQLRRRALKVLKVGLNVNAAVRLAI